MSEPVLAVDRLTKQFDKLTAVDSVDITVRRGDIFGFLGPNGAGKTTTIKMIAGLLLPTSGTISVDGLDSTAHALRCRALTGYIPDRPFLYEKLTGAEYISFVASLYRHRTDSSGRSDAEQYLRLFDLWEWRNNLIESYSHGMRQKLIMSSIFMLDQPLIVVDEPMVGLDPKSARIVKELFRSKAAEGTAIFLSTHSMEIAEELCSRVAIIRGGTIIAEGSVDSLKAEAAGDASNLEELFLQLTGSFELQDVVAALRRH